MMTGSSSPSCVGYFSCDHHYSYMLPPTPPPPPGRLSSLMINLNTLTSTTTFCYLSSLKVINMSNYWVSIETKIIVPSKLLRQSFLATSHQPVVTYPPLPQPSDDPTASDLGKDPGTKTKTKATLPLSRDDDTRSSGVSSNTFLNDNRINPFMYWFILLYLDSRQCCNATPHYSSAPLGVCPLLLRCTNVKSIFLLMLVSILLWTLIKYF